MQNYQLTRSKKMRSCTLEANLVSLRVASIFCAKLLITTIILCQQVTTSRAFLFHQLKPVSLSQSSSSSPIQAALSNPKSQLAEQQQQHHQAASRYQVSPASNQFALATDQQSPARQLDVSVPLQPVSCPRECHCSNHVADCSNRNLTRVPSAFPSEIKRINLNRNNISELGAHSFKSLKRLQRIDLSNNNLQRIDPLAFAGGLQSLSSLILYSNKLTQLPTRLFNELGQLQLLLLNDNALQCINRELFAPLANLNLLSLYDNKIRTLPNGTFDGLKSNSITIHLGKNPLICDCNLRWLADYFELNDKRETTEARCEGPARNQAELLSNLAKQRFKCEGAEQSVTSRLAAQCNPMTPPPVPVLVQQQDNTAQQQQQLTPTTSISGSESIGIMQQQAPVENLTCPTGCTCQGSTVDCSRVSQSQAPVESRVNVPGAIYELPDMPEDVPVYVTRVRMNDSRIKRIRQTSLFKQLANSQKIDLGNNRIIDVEDNAIGGQVPSNGISPSSKQTKLERIVFVLMEKDTCANNAQEAPSGANNANLAADDACSLAPRVNPPNFDSPCYNGGSCILGARSSSRSMTTSNYSCLCPPGFAGPLCEINIDDCVDHQCQNEATCIDGINSYRCQCRDPSTSGDYCEQLTYVTSSANSIAPMALPMVAPSNSVALQTPQTNSAPSNTQLLVDSLHQLRQYDTLMEANYKRSAPDLTPNSVSPQIQARSAHVMNQQQPQPTTSPSYSTNNQYSQQQPSFSGMDSLLQPAATNLDTISYSSSYPNTNNLINSNSNNNENNNNDNNSCRRVTTRKYLEDENGCQSVRSLKISECFGGCGQQQSSGNCCQPSKIKKRKVRMQCNDNASYVKIVDIVKKCSCSSKCHSLANNNQTIGLHDQFGTPTSSHQIETIDAIEI